MKKEHEVTHVDVVETPDKVTIWMHNHNVLKSLVYGAAAGAGFSLATAQWVSAMLFIALGCALYAMHRLQCGWMHTYVAYEMAREVNKVTITEDK